MIDAQIVGLALIVVVRSKIGELGLGVGDKRKAAEVGRAAHPDVGRPHIAVHVVVDRSRQVAARRAVLHIASGVKPAKRTENAHRAELLLAKDRHAEEVCLSLSLIARLS